MQKACSFSHSEGGITHIEGDLYLIDIDDASLGGLDIVVACLQQLEQN